MPLRESIPQAVAGRLFVEQTGDRSTSSIGARGQQLRIAILRRSRPLDYGFMGNLLWRRFERHRPDRIY